MNMKEITFTELRILYAYTVWCTKSRIFFLYHYFTLVM